MSEREIPAALRRAGLTGFTDNLPAGFEVNFHADFCRIFKDEIQRKGQAAAQPEPVTDSLGSR